MVQIDTNGLNVADLNNEEFQMLLDAEKKINQNNKDEVYLLAVRR
ncbi:hypothetical protein Dtox_1004 [Desulfofarcimen acetoxidans DSM 771]|uniref:Uncharacterized protein n=1 Tax=Desulfofarcimen acetoxidans (strain ATCC 49208 / DSM 771 / KCTC 5769 / VKM B-1644 / 5575) TaxID=485916 RepID=C8W3C3_DESAS|nr:hypothetical protein [Desulfofarcimen acetoxidans]ACV61890.1 hypothetical protein Dtox_1004 [Desulfofarcimen acetoxidans DSM 771]